MSAEAQHIFASHLFHVEPQRNLHPSILIWLVRLLDSRETTCKGQARKDLGSDAHRRLIAREGGFKARSVLFPILGQVESFWADARLVYRLRIAHARYAVAAHLAVN